MYYEKMISLSRWLIPITALASAAAGGLTQIPLVQLLLFTSFLEITLLITLKIAQKLL